MKKMMMNNVVIGKIVAGLLLVCGALGIVTPAIALACVTGSTTDYKTSTFNWAGSAAIDFGDISVSPTAQVGDVLATVTYGRLDGDSAALRMAWCDDQPTGTLSLGSSDFSTVDYNGEELVDIGITGLAVRLVNVGSDSAGSLWAFPPDMSQAESDVFGAATAGDYTGYALTVANFGNWNFELVKVADTVSSGTASSGTIATFSLSNPDDFDLSSSTIYSLTLTSFAVTAEACTVNSYDTSVDLGTASSQSFTAVGSTSSATDFAINMTCSSTSLSPTLTFSGTVDDNVSSVFANDSGTATGVGVQLLYGDTAITPDTAVSLGTATSTSATDYDFKARLYQTTSAVTAGSVDTTVNFTLEYE